MPPAMPCWKVDNTVQKILARQSVVAWAAEIDTARRALNQHYFPGTRHSADGAQSRSKSRPYHGGHRQVASGRRRERLEEFYDLAEDPFENDDILKGSLSEAEETAFVSLQVQVGALRESE